jgi:hypothetical protein
MRLTLKAFVDTIKRHQYYPCFSDLLDLIWLEEGTSYQELSLYNFKDLTGNDFKDFFFQNKIATTFEYGTICYQDKKIDKTIQFSNPKFDEDSKPVRFPGPGKFPINDLSYNNTNRILITEPVKEPVEPLKNIRQKRAVCTKVSEIKTLYNIKLSQRIEFVNSKGHVFFSI